MVVLGKLKLVWFIELKKSPRISRAAASPNFGSLVRLTIERSMLTTFGAMIVASGTPCALASSKSSSFSSYASIFPVQGALTKFEVAEVVLAVRVIVLREIAE